MIVIICLPSLYVLDKSIFDNKIPRLTLHCHGRNATSGRFKAYALHRIFYLLDDMKKYSDKGFAYKKNDPNFTGKFLDLTPERSEKLDKITIKGKLDILDMAGAKLEGLVNIRMIAGKIGKSVAWIRVVMAKLEIKPTKRIGRHLYYKGEVVDDLLEFMENGGVVTERKDEAEL